jgi:caffeoyl-CoA O-methyltransferase
LQKINVELIHPLVQSYAERYTSAEDDLLREIAEYTLTQHADPNMLSGHVQGKLLEMISRMIRPRRVLEIGTFTGYSALCLAAGLTEDGMLHTIDIREADVQLSRSYFDRSPLGKKIVSHCGNAAEVIPVIEETWDLVFIDADKPAYIDYFNLVLPRVKQNGFILADNILFHGQVLEGEPKGKSAKGIQAFNDFVNTCSAVDKLVLTVRDGLYLLRKL